MKILISMVLGLLFVSNSFAMSRNGKAWVAILSLAGAVVSNNISSSAQEDMTKSKNTAINAAYQSRVSAVSAGVNALAYELTGEYEYYWNCNYYVNQSNTYSSLSNSNYSNAISKSEESSRYKTISYVFAISAIYYGISALSDKQYNSNVTLDTDGRKTTLCYTRKF